MTTQARETVTMKELSTGTLTPQRARAILTKRKMKTALMRKNGTVRMKMTATKRKMRSSFTSKSRAMFSKKTRRRKAAILRGKQMEKMSKKAMTSSLNNWHLQGQSREAELSGTISWRVRIARRMDLWQCIKVILQIRCQT